MILKSFVSALPVGGLQTKGELKMRFKINIKKAAKSVSAFLLSGAVAFSGAAVLPAADFNLSVHAAWDGYKESDDVIGEFTLLDMNEYGQILNTGAIASRKILKADAFILHSGMIIHSQEIIGVQESAILNLTGF